MERLRDNHQEKKTKTKKPLKDVMIEFIVNQSSSCFTK